MLSPARVRELLLVIVPELVSVSLTVIEPVLVRVLADSIDIISCSIVPEEEAEALNVRVPVPSIFEAREVPLKRMVPELAILLEAERVVAVKSAPPFTVIRAWEREVTEEEPVTVVEPVPEMRFAVTSPRVRAPELSTSLVFPERVILSIERAPSSLTERAVLNPDIEPVELESRVRL